MNRSIVTLSLIALTVSAARTATAQTAAPVTASAAEARSDSVSGRLAPRRLSGPRFGFTVFTGDVADLRQRVGKEPIMTQFGWQTETAIASRANGNQALMEWVFLVGGVEQDELNFSLSWLTGYRLQGGLELGAGPAVSVSKDNTRPRTSMVVAGGATMPFGDLYIPVHMAVAMAEGGPRLTALIGWIID